MKILIIGNGGREHALAWKAAQSESVSEVFVAPGNAGTALESKVANIPLQTTEIEKLADFAKTQKIDLTLVGPENALALGVVDCFQKRNLACFGPSQAAAQLESSKVFCKDFLKRHAIPTADYACFTDREEAKKYVRQHTFPIVIKADGLAAGKGVVIAHTLEAADQTITNMLSGDAFDYARKRIVIEEFLKGEEVSFIVMVDGQHILPLATSQDHKARDNGDKGPNTGGMGAYSPAPIITPSLQERILKEIIRPTVKGMQAEDKIYTGFLYAGLMITKDGTPNVLEFNCRLGDPETQPILFRLRSDFIALCLAATNQQLATACAKWDPRPALTVVLTSAGYPLQYPTGEIIKGLPLNHAPDWKIFHAGTARQGDQFVTAGGRVLSVTALGNTLAEAQQCAYQIAKQISWQHIYYRTDIGRYYV